MNAPQSRPPFAWSFSALDNFETCGKKFYETQVAKNFKETYAHRDWGDAVHKAMANGVMHSSPLPPEMSKWEHWVKWAREPYDPNVMKLTVEDRLAITEKMEPCEYFDKQRQVWFRTVADVLKINGAYARIVDWKTGKPKTFLDQATGTWQTDSEQLKLGATAVFAHFPEVQHVKLDFVWLADNFFTSDVISRTDLPVLWQRMLPRVNAMTKAYYSGVYEPKPSGLCKRHCPVTSCTYHGRGSY